MRIQQERTGTIALKETHTSAEDCGDHHPCDPILRSSACHWNFRIVVVPGKLRRPNKQPNVLAKILMAVRPRQKKSGAEQRIIHVQKNGNSRTRENQVRSNKNTITGSATAANPYSDAELTATLPPRDFPNHDDAETRDRAFLRENSDRSRDHEPNQIEMLRAPPDPLLFRYVHNALRTPNPANKSARPMILVTDSVRTG